MIELRIALQPKQILCQQKMETTPVLLYGGAKGGGKSGGMRRILLIRRLKYPRTHAAIFRKSYPELYGNHIRKLLDEYPQLSPYYNDSKKLLTLPNGSTIEFCYAQNEKDLDNYHGREFHDLGIDEVGQWTESMFTKIWGSNRSSVPGVKPRTLLTGNPGGVGHSWLKRLFVTKQYTERERPQDYDFIQALVQDNAALIDNDPDYVHKLNAEKNEALRRAYLYGDWDIIAGAFFTELRREVHFIEPFEIPKHWKRFACLDHGFNHPAAVGWFACDEDGNVYQYREFVEAKKRIDKIAEHILSFDDAEKLEYIVAGHDCWQDRGVKLQSGAPTIAEEYANLGVFLSKANIGRVQGATQVRNYLAWDEKKKTEPRFKIFSTCPITFDCLTRMEHDPDRLEDVLKVDASEGDPMTGDDPYDMVRMALMSRPPLTDRPPPRHKRGSDAWSKQQAKEMEEALVRQYQEAKEIESGLRAPPDPWSQNPSEFDNDW